MTDDARPVAGLQPDQAPVSATWAMRIVRFLLDARFLVVLLLLVATMWLLDAFGQRTSLGRIFVDTPEVYTRERLVNDRFLQDAWLSRELERGVISDSHQTLSEHRGAAFKAGMGWDEPTAAGVGAKNASEEKDADLRLSSRALLLEKVDYRDVVRNLAIENQLDDRHDLNGNSLYRLKFDAAVLPGANTQASAQIQVRLRGPSFLHAAGSRSPLRSLSALGSSEDIDAWRTTYAKWIENLGSRLNQTQRELKQAYHNNEFAHNDYARLIAFLSKNLQVSTTQVSQCSTQFRLHGQGRQPLRLPADSHNARKACVNALVAKTVVKPQTSKDFSTTPGQAGGATEIGRYVKVPRAGTENWLVRESVISAVLDYSLNAYFGTKTLQLVLGLTVPESSFFGTGYYTISAFQPLVQLAFFNPFPKDLESDVFTVKQRIVSIAAIDKAKVKEDDLPKLYTEFDSYWKRLYETKRSRWGSYEDFSPRLNNVPFSVSTVDLSEIDSDDIDPNALVFEEQFVGRGVHVATAEVGLLNFARLARRHTHAFTYTVTPKESSDSVTFTLSTDASVDGRGVLPGESAKVALQMERAAKSRALERRNAVVGFSTFTNDGSAEFGWLISPRHTAVDGQRLVQVQTPGQYPLSALVSMPSWWNHVLLEITSSWIDQDGEVRKIGKPVSHVVDIATDFEPLEAIMLGVAQLGPELMESRLDPVLLTACRPGSIVIPGRRLWRSTKVTLGYQPADSIAVLPNMKGIIARFNEVQNQVSVSDTQPKTGNFEISRPVRVWTSQGSITLPTPAQIGITGDCKPHGSTALSSGPR